jgi:hypothetical protein
MNIKDNYSDLGKSVPIFRQKRVPVFQNKVYSSKNEALKANYGIVELVQSPVSGFIFNKAFEPEIMNYDVNYQNEQSNSAVFKEHLRDVLGLLKQFGIKNKRVVEIGVGKGVFFEMMIEEGIDCWGFDPTYEGTNERVVKKYFNHSINDINADVIILRHTLEHIPKPFTFLHNIAKVNNYQGYLFVEVPTFDWITQKQAFWDIFYEHCNYFTESSLSIMFEEAITGSFFAGQYIYIWAELSKLRNFIPSTQINIYNAISFEDKVNEISNLFQNNGKMAIWGAGAKGSTILNLIDAQNKYIEYVIDINPKKQDKFIACTGHPIYSPNKIKIKPIDGIIVMNENYLSEIKSMLEETNINVFNL